MRRESGTMRNTIEN